MLRGCRCVFFPWPAVSNHEVNAVAFEVGETYAEWVDQAWQKFEVNIQMPQEEVTVRNLSKEGDERILTRSIRVPASPTGFWGIGFGTAGGIDRGGPHYEIGLA